MFYCVKLRRLLLISTQSVLYRECGELVYGRRLPLLLKGAVHGSYVVPAILYGSEAWCLKE